MSYECGFVVSNLVDGWVLFRNYIRFEFDLEIYFGKEVLIRVVIVLI